MPKPHIKRPTAAEIAAILSPSYAYEKIELHKPAFDYLASCFGGSRVRVSEYVSNRITNELVRLSKMPSGGNHTGWRISDEQRAANARSRWAKVEKRDSVRVRVGYKPHKVFMELNDGKRDRPVIAGEIIAQGAKSIDRAALLAYCAANPHKPQEFVTLPKDAVDAAKVIANENSVSYSKVVGFILESHN